MAIFSLNANEATLEIKILFRTLPVPQLYVIFLSTETEDITLVKGHLYCLTLL